ncbi:hypothetical protein AJ78_01067 [Emergomyces pasteurianus Ep9510]|uniref:Uncharacterized protein n=1 Tax=Emergomyces pasteurianus Ep9510 TaxID=1447872 RepID=A0A1J9QFJ5_9EURO|nr:hypothetical protein AJ78_01067 [Emergomyces pasteurianus Ep9510]
MAERSPKYRQEIQQVRQEPLHVLYLCTLGEVSLWPGPLVYIELPPESAILAKVEAKINLPICGESPCDLV